MTEHDDIPLLCHRCGATLHQGHDDHYVVRIEAFADPTPPRLAEGDIPLDIDAEIEALLEQMKDMTERELMDQVYRRLIIHLCGKCYRTWIEDPAK